MTLYKTMDGTAGAYGHGEWFMPVGKRPGKWMPKVPAVLCESGYHYCDDPLDLLHHYGPDLYEIEVRGEVVRGDNKSCAEQARLLRRVPAWSDYTLRMFAIDCARRVAYLVKDDDEREWYGATLDLLTGFAEFGTGGVEGAAWGAARDAAWDAALGAARDAARGAAWGAAWGEQSTLLTRYLDGEIGPLVERES